jgi:chemotaxis signal transduction protein
MSSARDWQQAVAGLRLDFDRAFAGAPEAARGDQLDLLLVRVAERPYALRLSDIAAVHAERRIVPVPTPDSKLRGLVGLRGGLAPVFDLALTLGHSRAEAPHWLLELRSPKPCALAFDELLQHLRLPADALARTVTGGATHRFSSGNAPSPGGPVAVIDLLAAYAELTGQSPPTPGGERKGRT